jgi:hypothetical protein
MSPRFHEISPVVNNEFGKLQVLKNRKKRILILIRVISVSRTDHFILLQTIKRKKWVSPSQLIFSIVLGIFFGY